MRLPHQCSRVAERMMATGSLRLLLVLLLPLPLLLVAHQLTRWGTPPFESPRWDVNTDRSWIEVIGYAAGLAAAVQLVIAWVRSHAPVYAAWAITLIVIVLDDALEVHERAGGGMVERTPLPTPAGLDMTDVGQLLVWALLALVLGTGLCIAHARSGPRPRSDSRRLAGLLAALVVFAAGVYVLQVAVRGRTSSGAVDFLFMTTEAGGEYALLAAMAAYTLHLLRRPPTSGPPAGSTLATRPLSGILRSVPAAPRHLAPPRSGRHRGAV